jgi:peroxiredoxin
MHRVTFDMKPVFLMASVMLLSHASAASAALDLEFKMGDHRGRQWTMQDFEDSKLIAFVFMGTECPLAKLYAGRLEELHQEFRDRGVSIVGVNANTQDSLTEIGHWVDQYNLKFPVLKDRNNRLADLLEAERTPEVVLVDAERQIRYRGRIDDQYIVGRARHEVRRRDLAIAIGELLDGRDVSVPSTEPVGCHIGRVRHREPKGEITYASHVAAIFNNRCRECHRRGEIAPFELTRYEDVLGWEDTILEVIADNRMPPWFANPDHGVFANDARLSEKEKEIIRTWVDNGMPPGDLSQVPDPPKFVEGWRMPEPDQIIHWRPKPFKVQAEGVVDYQYYEVDPGWDEDKYIVAAEARPDRTDVVHHIIAYVVPGDADEEQKRRSRRMLVGYAPGSQPNVMEDGIAMRVPAGSKLLFEMHYTPNGTATEDLSYIGVKFTDKQKVRKLLHGGLAIETDFQIPPHADHHKVTAEYQARQDQLLLEMTPHMHLRGKAFTYEAFYPDGTHEILLDVPNYDFNWQLTYELAEPKLLPKGTRIVCTAVYDNSAENIANPDPTRPVTWGDQSFEEMMIGFFSVVAPDKPKLTTAVDEQ